MTTVAPSAASMSAYSRLIPGLNLFGTTACRDPWQAILDGRRPTVASTKRSR